MIVREIKDSDEIWLISQVHHGWQTGQIARLWGNEHSSVPEPKEDLIMAASLHDIGWLNWEMNLDIHPETGLPYNFLEMPSGSHLDIWRNGTEYGKQFGTLIALLILRHNAGLAGKQNFDSLGPEKKKLYESFFEENDRVESGLLNILRDDPRVERYCEEERLSTLNRHLLLWDYLSLRLCMGAENESPFGSPPSPDGKNYHLEPVSDKGVDGFYLSPWPFYVKEVHLKTEVRILNKDEIGQKELGTIEPEIRVMSFLKA